MSNSSQSHSQALLDATVALGLMGAAAVCAYLAWGYGIGDLSAPGPGGFPFVLSVGLFISAFVALFAPIRQLIAARGATARNAGSETEGTSGGAELMIRAAALVTILVIWALVMKWLGFAVAAVGGIIAINLLSGQKSLRRAIVFSVILTAGCYLLFSTILGLPL